MRNFLRRCRLNPGSAALLFTVTLAAGTCLGAGYLLMDAVLWRPLPGIPDSKQLIVANFASRTGGLAESVPLAYFDDLQAVAGSGRWCPFSSGALSKVAVNGATNLRPVSVWMKSCEAVFGVAPLLGRFSAEGEPDGHRGVVISETFWEREFHRDPHVLGKSMLLDDLPVAIIGVAPAAFMGLSVEIAPEVFAPINHRSGQLVADGRPVTFRYLVGRVEGGPPATFGDALRDRLTRLLEARTVTLPEARRVSLAEATVRVDATGRGQSYLRDNYSAPVRALTMIGGLLLVMALANVAGVAYAQTRGRGREFIVREFLGASLGRHLKLLSGELLWLIGLGMAGAVLLSTGFARLLSQYLWTSATPNSMILEAGPGTALVFVAIGVVFASVAMGSSAWALSAIRTEAPAQRQSHGGMVLSMAQCAISVAVLFTAGILAYGVWHLSRSEMGFVREGLVFTRLLPATLAPPPPDQQDHYQRLLAEIRSTPGVEKAALAAGFPRQVRGSVRADHSQTPMTVSYDTVSDEFFDVVGITLREGRVFGAADTPQTDRVALVTQNLAARLFPDGTVLGRHLLFGQPEQPYTVIGIVADVRLDGARQPPVPTVYTSRGQQPSLNPMVVARTSGPSAALLAPISAIINRAGRDYPVGILTIEDDIRRALAPERTLQLLAWVLGALVAALVATGLVAQQVTWAATQRRSTIIRMILGEPRSGVATRMVRRAAVFVGTGVLVGVPLALGLGALLQRVLPGFDSRNAWLLTGVAIGVIVIGTVVSYLPTRFLSRLEPSEIFRAER